MQWADASLLDFIEYLLEWSRNHPLFVVTLARPELHERRPTWGAGQRNFTSLYLEPLPQAAMERAARGAGAGAAGGAARPDPRRAEGIPLYAVETVRMLLDRGPLVAGRRRLPADGPIESLEVPETLQALIAARLDGLTRAERRLFQDAAVLGKTFSRLPWPASRASRKPDLDPLLGALVRKEVLALQADPRSPEHGQYGFLQDLVRHVAYETLAKARAAARHLAAADLLTPAAARTRSPRSSLRIYLDAYRAAPEPTTPTSCRLARQARSCRPGSAPRRSAPRPRPGATSSRRQDSSATPGAAPG